MLHVKHATLSMTNMTSDDRYMSRLEVAELFLVHPSTVDRWAKNGRLGEAAFTTPGGQWRYKRAELVQLAAGMGFGGGQPSGT